MADWDLTGDLENDLALAKVAAAKIAAAAPASPLKMVDKPTRSAEVPNMEKDPEQIPYTPITKSAGEALPVASLLMGNPSSFLGRMALNSGIGAASEGLKHEGDPGAMGIGALAGPLAGGLEKVGQGVRYLGSAIPKKMFDASQEAKITDWLKQKIPWWNDLNVSEMATSTKAKDALRQGYDEAFVAAKEKIAEDATASIPLEVANALKMKGEGGLDTRFLSPKVLDLLQNSPGRAVAGAGAAVDTVTVNARELLDKLPGSKGRLRAQILNGLDPVAGSVIPEAREAYRTGQGWLELANRGGIGKEGVFNAQTAQAALRKPAGPESLAQKALQPRDMGELESIVQGPLAKPITSQSPNSLAWHLGLGAGGALGGFGLQGLHGLAGGLAAMAPKPTFYRNVPPMLPQAGPLAQQGMRVVMPGFLGQMNE